MEPRSNCNKSACGIIKTFYIEYHIKSPRKLVLGEEIMSFSIQGTLFQNLCSNCVNDQQI